MLFLEASAKTEKCIQQAFEEVVMKVRGEHLRAPRGIMSSSLCSSCRDLSSLALLGKFSCTCDSTCLVFLCGDCEWPRVLSGTDFGEPSTVGLCSSSRWLQGGCDRASRNRGCRRWRRLLWVVCVVTMVIVWCSFAVLVHPVVCLFTHPHPPPFALHLESFNTRRQQQAWVQHKGLTSTRPFLSHCLHIRRRPKRHGKWGR